ncbi:MAG: hypothetical protein GY866_32210 [Proteobacteria bacterium]|nr:hypothetical protein [Pseudomonadota bacterium]
MERNGAYQIDARDIVGPIDAQIRDACRFVASNMRVQETKSPHRIDKPAFSMNAVFEAVVNAVVHRDYSIQILKIRVHMLSDRLLLPRSGSQESSESKSRGLFTSFAGLLLMTCV